MMKELGRIMGGEERCVLRSRTARNFICGLRLVVNLAEYQAFSTPINVPFSIYDDF
jgi:hypothetical protein